MRIASKQVALQTIKNLVAGQPLPPYSGSIGLRNTFATWHQNACTILHQLGSSFEKPFADAIKPVNDWNTDQVVVLEAAATETRELLAKSTAEIEAWPPLSQLSSPVDLNDAARAIFGVLVAKYKMTGNSNVSCDWKDPLWQEMGITQKDARMACEALESSPLAAWQGQEIKLARPVGIRAVAQPKIVDEYFPPSKSETTNTKAMSNSIRIFISHSSVDAAIAKKLIDFIEASLDVGDKAIRCTSVPGYRLEGGDNAPNVLRANIGECGAVLAIITKASMRSSYVLLELGAAWMAEKRAVPLVGPGATFSDLPAFFSDIHAIPLTDAPQMSGLISTLERATGARQRDNHERRIAVLAELVKAVQDAATEEPPPAATPPKRDVDFTLTYKKEPTSTGTHHGYVAHAKLTNFSKKRIDDCMIELVMPRKYCAEGGVGIEVEGEDKSVRRFLFQNLKASHLPPLIPGQSREIKIRYAIDSDLYRNQAGKFPELVEARGYVDGELISEHVRPMQDMQEF